MSATEAFIVDDDPVVSHIVSSMLLSSGIATKSFADGASCLKELHNRVALSKPLPAVVFLDLLLLEQKGTEVLQKIRAITGCAVLPVIMLSANSEDEARDNTNSEQPNYFLAKPFTTEQLLTALKAVGL